MGLINNKNAFIGNNVEKLFKNSIKDQPLVVEEIKKYFGISGDIDNAIQSGVHGEKADVKIGFTCGHMIDVNIKAYEPKIGFNQLTRASVKRFCEIFQITDTDRVKLEKIVTDKSKNPNDNLFPQKEQSYWLAFFNPLSKDILKWGFSHKQSREILVLFDRDSNKMRIYPMKDVLKSLKNNITFTKGGFNIGDCVSFQRKGGNGSLSKTIPKNSIDHPGNNLQLKLKVKIFITLMDDVLLADYTI